MSTGNVDSEPAREEVFYVYPQHGSCATTHAAGRNVAMPARLNLWLYDEFLKRLDRWRRAQENPPTRSVALKHMAERGMDEIEREMDVGPLGSQAREPDR